MICDGSCLTCTLDLSLCPLELEPEDDFSMLTAEDYRGEAIKAALDERTLREKAIAAYQKEYYEANRDAIAAKKREYYEANRDAIAAKKREYYEANRDAIAAKQKKIKDARKARGYTQLHLARLVGVSHQAISFWERGEVPAPWDKLIPVLPELAEVVS